MILFCPPPPPSDVCRTQFLISFVLQSPYILARYSIQTATLLTEGWCVSCWGKKRPEQGPPPNPSSQPHGQLLGALPSLEHTEIAMGWSPKGVSARLVCSSRTNRRGHWGSSITTTAMLEIIILIHTRQLSYENAFVSKVCFNRNISIMHCSLL